MFVKCTNYLKWVTDDKHCSWLSQSQKTHFGHLVAKIMNFKTKMVNILFNSQKHTLMLMQFGQFLDHDLTLTPMMRQPNGSLIDCSSCNSDRKTCSPIEVSDKDPFFPAYTRDGAKRCLEFTRSNSVNMFGYKDQINLVSSWLDGSMVNVSCFHNEVRLLCLKCQWM